ncbi:hypothetical protein MDA_GLEAN10014524 [Myotis davidii]|uniref:Uncharacterized protein n=1 Tax=Myotis davidii TaxID=225400 RepID=L5M0L3_MYODS|nr:hypothetical protein MDA_GLEAN10014524 [Myotis davidii]
MRRGEREIKVRERKRDPAREEECPGREVITREEVSEEITREKSAQEEKSSREKRFHTVFIQKVPKQLPDAALFLQSAHLALALLGGVCRDGECTPCDLPRVHTVTTATSPSSSSDCTAEPSSRKVVVHVSVPPFFGEKGGELVCDLKLSLY